MKNLYYFHFLNRALGLYDKVIEYCKDAGFEPNVVQEVFELEVIY